MNIKKSNTHEEILRYLENQKTVDKDAAFNTVDNQKSSWLHKSPKHRDTYSIDLHGLNCEQAAFAVRRCFEKCRSTGIRRILIVHGVGLHSDPEKGPQLKKLVRTMLEHELSHCVRDYRSAPTREGGDGATVVFLK